MASQSELEKRAAYEISNGSQTKLRYHPVSHVRPAARWNCSKSHRKNQVVTTVNLWLLSTFQLQQLQRSLKLLVKSQIANRLPISTAAGIRQAFMNHPKAQTYWCKRILRKRGMFMLRIHVIIIVDVQHLAKAVLLFCSPMLELMLPQAFSKPPTTNYNFCQISGEPIYRDYRDPIWQHQSHLYSKGRNSHSIIFT